MSNRCLKRLVAALLIALEVSLLGFNGKANAVAAQDTTHSVQISKEDLLILIRQILTALDLSNKSGNYGILREISAPGFAAVNDSARLSALFRDQRERGIDYSGTLVYEPQITAGPEMTKDGNLRFQGFFPSASRQIKFEMHFSPVNGKWKLFGLAVDEAPAGPVAPALRAQPVQPGNPPAAAPKASPAPIKP